MVKKEKDKNEKRDGRHIKQRAERDMEGAPQQKNMLSDSILGN